MALCSFGFLLSGKTPGVHLFEITSALDLSRGRCLTIDFQGDGQLLVWLDQGLSYWLVARQQRQTALAAFNMKHPVSAAGDALAEFRVDVQGHDLSTQVFVDRRELRWIYVFCPVPAYCPIFHIRRI
jgi:hypothetical protein